MKNQQQNKAQRSSLESILEMMSRLKERVSRITRKEDKWKVHHINHKIQNYSFTIKIIE